MFPACFIYLRFVFKFPLSGQASPRFLHVSVFLMLVTRVRFQMRPVLRPPLCRCHPGYRPHSISVFRRVRFIPSSVFSDRPGGYGDYPVLPRFFDPDDRAETIAASEEYAVFRLQLDRTVARKAATETFMSGLSADKILYFYTVSLAVLAATTKKKNPASQIPAGFSH